MKYQIGLNSILLVGLFIAATSIVSEANAQRRPIRIGGPNGVVIGGGQGVRIGGINGAQFWSGGGARFGPPGRGVQLGGGQGLRIASIPFRNYGNAGSRMAYPSRTPTPMNALSNQKTLGLPASAKEPFKYRLNGTPYQLNPGREINLHPNQRWTVTFSPGDQQPDRSVSIDRPGLYLFTESNGSWNLVRQNNATSSERPVTPRRSNPGDNAPTTMDKARKARTNSSVKQEASEAEQRRSVLDEPSDKTLN